MSDRSTVERPAAALRRNAEMSINNLTFLVGVGAIVATVVGGSCSTNVRIGELHAEIRDVRAEIRDVRAEVGGVRTELGMQIGGVRTELGMQIGGVRTELGMQIGGVRTELGAQVDDSRAQVGGLRAEVGAEIRDVRAEVRGVRARVEALEDSTTASFATVHRQLSAVAVCMLEIRSLVGGDDPDRGGASTACDSAVRAILAPSAPTGR